MKTMTIRNIPDEVADYIGKRAMAEGRSQNLIAVMLLNAAAGFIPQAARKKRDLSRFCGVWTEEEYRQFNRLIDEHCEQVDPRDWETSGN